MQQAKPLTQFWTNALQNLTETIKTAIRLGYSDIEGDFPYRTLIVNKSIPDLEKTYRGRCEQYHSIFEDMIAAYITYHFPRTKNVLRSEKGDITKTGNLSFVKDCIKHLCYANQSDGDRIDDDLIHAILLTDLGKYLLEVHPDLISLNEDCMNRGGLLSLCFDFPFGSYEYVEIKKTVEERGQYVIRRLPVEAICRSIEDLESDNYNLSGSKEQRKLIQVLIFYSYEKEKGQKLKSYTSNEILALEGFILNEISYAENLSTIQLIYDEHINASYMQNKLLLSMQEKALDILTDRAQCDILSDTQKECQAALLHPMFKEDSLIRRKIEHLLKTLDEAIEQTGHSRKRKFRA